MVFSWITLITYSVLNQTYLYKTKSIYIKIIVYCLYIANFLLLKRALKIYIKSMQLK